MISDLVASQGTDSDALRMDCFFPPPILILVLLFIGDRGYGYRKTLLWGFPITAAGLLQCL